MLLLDDGQKKLLEALEGKFDMEIYLIDLEERLAGELGVDINKARAFNRLMKEAGLDQESRTLDLVHWRPSKRHNVRNSVSDVNMLVPHIGFTGSRNGRSVQTPDVKYKTPKPVI